MAMGRDPSPAPPSAGFMPPSSRPRSEVDRDRPQPMRPYRSRRCRPCLAIRLLLPCPRELPKRRDRSPRARRRPHGRSTPHRAARCARNRPRSRNPERGESPCMTQQRGEHRAIMHHCSTTNLAKRPEAVANLFRKEFRLLPGRKMPAFVERVVVDEVAIRPLGPTPRGFIELVGKDADGSGDRNVQGVEDSCPCFPNRVEPKRSPVFVSQNSVMLSRMSSRVRAPAGCPSERRADHGRSWPRRGRASRPPARWASRANPYSVCGRVPISIP